MKVEYKKVKNPQNKYGINTSWMSGDADAYEDKYYTFKTEEEAIEYYTFLKSFIGQDFNYGDIAEKFREKFEEIPSDATSNHEFYATLDSVDNPIYYDKNGIKFEMIITKD